MRLGEAELRQLRDLTKEKRTAKEISEIIGCSETTVNNWWAKFREAGVDLQVQRGPRPRDLTKL